LLAIGFFKWGDERLGKNVGTDNDKQ
jgi:hypothetical protein